MNFPWTEDRNFSSHIQKNQACGAIQALKRLLFKNSVGKGEIARNEQFLLFSQRFLPFLRSFHHFHPIQNCCLQALNLSVEDSKIFRLGKG